MKKVEKVNIAIIIILTGVLCLFAGYVMFTEVMKVNDNSKDNGSEKVSKSSIGLEDRIELNNLIDNDLVALLYKEKLNDLSDLELRTLIMTAERNNIYIKATNENSENASYVFTSDELKKAYNNSVFSELKYEDGNIGGVCAGVVSDLNIYIYDSETKTYNANPNTGMGCNMARPYVYTYNVDSYRDGDKYVIVNKYLFGSNNPIDKVEMNKYLFGSANDYEDYLNGYRYNTKIDTSKSVTALDSIGTEYVDTSLFEFSLNKFTSDYKNYDSIKDKLDTYTYTFEKKDGHFVITDFSVEHSK